MVREEETDARGNESREKVCKVCESDRRTVAHLMKEYASGQRERGERERKKREKVLGTENDELDWTEQVMRKRSGRKGESKAQGKGRYAATRSNLRDVGRQ